MTDFLLIAFVFLAAGVTSVPIAARLGLGSVLGYLIAGIAISPLLSILHVDVISIQHFAEFGVVMMLFLVGLELEPKKLWGMRQRLLGLGGLQILFTVFIVMIVARVLGQAWSVSLAIGLVLALSSTAIVLQTLGEKGLLKSDAGQASFSVLLFQDIAVIGMLALIPLLALEELAALNGLQGASDEHASGLSLVAGLAGWQAALVTLGAIAFVLFVGSFLTRPLFRFISSARLRELFTATALLIVIGIALLMVLVGLSPALGTFLAGVVLANSEYRHELESDIDPFKGLLLGLFFITVGASINFSLLADNYWQILGLTFGLIFIKALVVYLLAMAFKIKGSDRWLFALGLAQAGEFGFVLLSFTVASAVIPVPVADQLMLVVALSMLLTPLLFIVHDKLIVPRYTVEQQQKADKINDHSDIIILGHGRIGGLVNRMMRGAGHKTTVIDYSSAQLDMLRMFGLHAFFGDGSRPDLLKAAGIDQAKILVVAIEGKQKITELVRFVVKHYPHIHIVARAVDRTHVYDLWSVGCRDIIREYYDSAIRMGRSAIEATGVSRGKADKIASTFEAMDRTSMLEVAQLYDVNIPPLENKPYIEKINELMKGWELEMTSHLNNVDCGSDVEATHRPTDDTLD